MEITGKVTHNNFFIIDKCLPNMHTDWQTNEKFDSQECIELKQARETLNILEWTVAGQRTLDVKSKHSCTPDKVFRDFHQRWQILSYIPLSDLWDT